MKHVIFFYYKMSEERCRVTKHNLADDPASYCLYGARELEKRGFSVLHNLEPDIALSSFRHSLVSHIDHFINLKGYIWGNLETVLAYRKRANAADVIVATVDNVGIPIAFMKLMGLIRPPVIYVSIGLPERIMRARSRFWTLLCKAALRRMAYVIAYGFEEALWLRKCLNDTGTSVPVDFVPFGVNAEYFHPLLENVSHQVDVLSIGAWRDYALLFEYARQHPGIQVMIVTRKESVGTLEPVPANVTVVYDIPFSEVRGLLAGASVVALPVQENTYSGATTTLLQAMAMAKPTVVSRVGAIREGYGLRDCENCLLVKPGDFAEFESAIDRLLSDRLLADKIGQGARTLAVSSLSWDKYVDAIIGVLEKVIMKTRTCRNSSED
jgi:glycosyltransferase involved in cell wall biosynthesis